jgi:hypothetical protein
MAAKLTEANYDKVIEGVRGNPNEKPNFLCQQ